MRDIRLNDYVRLAANLPEHSLPVGQIGVVRQVCPFAPLLEVEFHPVAGSRPVLQRLEANQVRLEEGPLFKAVEDDPQVMEFARFAAGVLKSHGDRSASAQSKQDATAMVLARRLRDVITLPLPSDFPPAKKRLTQRSEQVNAS